MYMENESLLPSLKDKENQDLAVAMNSVVVHSRFVDSIDELFIETCDLSFMGCVMLFRLPVVTPLPSPPLPTIDSFALS